VSLAANIAPVDVTRVLAITNAFRRIHGFVWYYNASADAASRVLSTRLRQPGLALPTGLTTAIGVWNAANLTLTASEEGIVFVMRNRSILNDNSNDPTTIDSTATAPTPFPYDATEDDLADLFFDVTDANANDRHSIYLLQEEWLSI